MASLPVAMPLLPEVCISLLCAYYGYCFGVIWLLLLEYVLTYSFYREEVSRWYKSARLASSVSGLRYLSATLLGSGENSICSEQAQSRALSHGSKDSLPPFSILFKNV